MAVTVANFRIRFPSFGITGTAVGEVPDNRVQMYLDDATLYLADYATCIGAKLDLATYYLAAHYLSMNQQYDSFGTPINPSSSNQGALKRVKIGDIEKEYNYSSSSSATTDSDMQNSEYGKICWSMIKACVIAATPSTITVISRGAVTL